jgi:IS5 family transposase
MVQPLRTSNVSGNNIKNITHELLREPDKFPYRNTIWYFRERLSKTGKDRLVLNETKDQIMAKRIRIKKGTIQGASFIESYRNEHGDPRDKDANTRRSKDGAFATKNHSHHYVYKKHKLINEIEIIEKLSVTPANVHDPMIDLSIPGIVYYRDTGYFGSECKRISGTMDRTVRNHNIPVKRICRNLRISRIRTMVEHQYAFMKRMF